ncbi:MAG: hypothetical protein ACI9IP_001796 [Arcticibacterium sp.]|jgi:hypothetical protein
MIGFFVQTVVVRKPIFLRLETVNMSEISIDKDFTDFRFEVEFKNDNKNFRSWLFFCYENTVESSATGG